MLKKAVLVSFVAMLLILSSSLAFALETNGLISGTSLTGVNNVEGVGTFTFPAGLAPSINPGGLGDALIYGYYNVRGNVNLFNIVNTDTVNGAKIRVVFRNGKTSEEVLDFSVCLSQGDVWTAYLLDDGTAGHIYGGVDTDTITSPAITSTGQEFAFGGTTLADVTADDTREGYFEIVSFSQIPNYDKNASTTANCTSSSGPQNCVSSASQCSAETTWTNTTPVGNVLFGNNTIVKLSDLETYSYNATAIADAFPEATSDPGPGKELSIPSSMAPPTFYNDTEDVPTSSCVAFDWLFMKDTVYTPYDIMTALAGQTDLIITFPSRHACHSHIDAPYSDGDDDSNNMLGAEMFDCTAETNSSDKTLCTAYCTNVGLSVWDDKENTLTSLAFSPSQGSCLPNEVNVIHIGGSAIWNTSLGTTVNVGTFQLGWLAVSLTDGENDHAILWNDDTLAMGVMHGLPAIAYTTQDFESGEASYMVPAIYDTLINETNTVPFP